MSTYPTTLDTFPAAATLAAHALDTDPHSTLHGNLGAAIVAVETALGALVAKPTWTNAVAYSTLRARLAALTIYAADFGVVGDNTTNCGDKLDNAIQYAATLGARLVLPPGKIVMKTAAGAVKKITVDMTSMLGVFEMVGQGEDSTQLIWSQDIGTGLYGITWSNTSQTVFPYVHGLSAYNTLYTSRSDPNGTAIPTSAGSFMNIPNRARFANLAISGFAYGLVSDGDDSGSGSTTNTDHVDIESVDIQTCIHGIYFLGNNRKSRDYIIRRALIHACQKGGCGVAQDGEITDATFYDCHWNANPFAFWKEGTTPSDTGFLSNVQFVRCKAEGEGNGFFWCEATDGSGDLQRVTGFFEFHGIETNGQPTGTGGGISDHGVGTLNHTWRPYAITAMSRDGSGTVTATIASAPSPALKVGDSIVVWVSDNHTMNSSVYGGFNIKTISGTTYTWEQTGAASGPVSAQGGPCVAVRAGSFYESDLQLSILTDPTTILTSPELNWDLQAIDDVRIEHFGGVGPPAIRCAGTTNGRKENVLFVKGASQAFLCQANGTFAAGNCLEQSANGNAVISTVTVTAPFLGVALQPGATTIAVASQVVSLKQVFVHARGRNSNFAIGGAGTGYGPGVIVSADPTNVAVLCEDVSNPGQAKAWPGTTGTWRIIGRSVAAASGGFADYVAQDPYVVKI
jgi:hypothetical protein